MKAKEILSYNIENMGNGEVVLSCVYAITGNLLSQTSFVLKIHIRQLAIFLALKEVRGKNLIKSPCI